MPATGVDFPSEDLFGLDSGQKYGLDESGKGSFSPFINKLMEKKKSNNQRKQAVKAITTCCE